MNNKNILIVDDKADIRMSLRFLLSNHHYSVTEAPSLSEAKFIICNQDIDLVLLDMNYQLDTTSGEEGLFFIKDIIKISNVPIIAMTAWSSVDLAVQAMQAGAVDFFAKPWDNSAVLQLVEKHLSLIEIAPQNTKNEVQPKGGVLWLSEPMQALKRQLDRVANSNASLLLRGENGTGKSAIAHYVHQTSGRSGEFVSVNVAAIPENLFESELFGHKKGAFTDAVDDRVGRFEQAKNGTLFLDEIGCLAKSQQAKLLRVLESNEFERVGDNKTQTASCRIICATNADFESMLQAGEFRTDLYFRLNTIELIIPPLNVRQDEIIELANYFLHKHCESHQIKETLTLSDCAVQALKQYDFPGNVRELSHLMARAALLADDDTIVATDLAFKKDKTSESLPMMTLESAEKKLLKMALVQTDNQVEQAASLLGISKSAIYRRLDKYDIKTR